MAASAEGEGPITGVNMTPLVDVVLVLLIIFMATAPTLSRRAVKVDLPRAARHERAATEAVSVSLDSALRVSVAGRPVARADLRRILESEAARAARPVTVAADRGVPYGEVAALLDDIRGAGVRKVGLEVARR